jgi:UDP-glucose 4-epimerase
MARIVVTGATGNVGTSLVRRLARSGDATIVAVARRPVAFQLPGVEWVAADVATAPLGPIVRGADAVVHLAWRIQPSRDPESLWRTNVLGSQRVFRSAVSAGVPALVYASSVGAYSPRPGTARVDESWPVEGMATSTYSRQKAEVERRLDRLEQEHPELRVVRLRPSLTFKREAASGIRRLFAGPFLPSRLLLPLLRHVVPFVQGLRFQAVHTDDVAEAYALAIAGEARGAFNIAAEPVLDREEIVSAVGGRPFQLPEGVARLAVAAAWKLRLQPSEPGWVDLGLGAPLLDTRRAQRDLAWSPTLSGREALLELLEGMTDSAGAATPPLDPSSGGLFRAAEIRSGIGSRERA